MESRVPYRKQVVHFVVLLSLIVTSDLSIAVPATWVNGTGNYSDVTKWDVPITPCNAGATQFQVIIPDNIGTVSDDVPTCNIDTLILGDNSTFSILSGNSYTANGQADIFGIVRGIGGNFSAVSASFPGDRARVIAEQGAIVTIGATSYSSVGLDSATLMSATGIGSAINLSSMTTMNAAYSTGSLNAPQYVSATNGGTINLSGLTSVTGPARLLDSLNFLVTDTANLNLPNLQNVDGVGPTRFQISAGGSLSLPALNSVANVQFLVSDNGSLLEATGTPWIYSSTGLDGATLMSATGVGATLDLSSMTTMNAAYSTGSLFVNQLVSASGSGTINLSGLTKVTGPARSLDRLVFRVTDSAIIDLSVLKTIESLGPVSFELLLEGQLLIGDLSKVQAATYITLKDSTTKLIAPGSLSLNTFVSLSAVADALVAIGKDYLTNQTNEAYIDIEAAVVHFNGTGTQLVEVGGVDIGTLIPVDPNFSFGQMIVGSETQTTTVHLRDQIDNGNGYELCGAGTEALYLMGLPADPGNPGKIVNGLRILGGSTLFLDGTPLYIMQDGFLQDVRDWFGPGQTIISYALNNSNGFIDLGSRPIYDTDSDGVPNDIDNCVYSPNGPLIPDAGGNSQRDTDGDGFGNVCDADFNGDFTVNLSDYSVFRSAFGTTDPDADFNGDGTVNLSDYSIFRASFGKAPGPSCSGL